MFDYIVKKERLEESEARHFFRQLVQAIAYVHSMGFAHRDLKPVSRSFEYNCLRIFRLSSENEAKISDDQISVLFLFLGKSVTD